MSNVVASVIQSGIQKAVAAASLHLTTETRDEFLGPVLSKFTKTGTGKSLVELAALADGMRVVFETLLADGKITSQEIEVSKSFISKVAAQLGKVRSQYSSFQNGSEFEIMPFLKQYREDTGTFGYKDESTRWSGLKVCANIAKKTGDETAYKLMSDALLQGAKALLMADGMDKKEKEYLDKLRFELLQNQEPCQTYSKTSKAITGSIEIIQADFEVLHLENDNQYMEWLKNNYQRIDSWRKAADANDPLGQYLMALCYVFGLGFPENKTEAVKLFRKAAEQGLSQSQYILGMCYYFGEGVKKDEKEGFKWYCRAAEQGHVEAQFKVGCSFAAGYICEEDKKEAAKWISMAAEHGHDEAQFVLGDFYLNGENVEEDTDLAVDWYRKAADQGNAKAQNKIGDLYCFGEGVQEDKILAAGWYRKAAEQGNSNSQHMLGGFYLYGEGGLKENHKEAVKWIRKSAEQGHSDAQHKLGLLFLNGRGVNKDHKEAVKWIRKSAEQGHSDAYAALEGCYREGYGVKKDLKEAVKWCRKAADQGNVGAQFNLGVYYENGDGVEEDKKEALKWYRKAAEQGHANAQYNLGFCYGNGDGVKKNLQEAIKWIRLAAEQGHEGAKDFLKDVLGDENNVDFSDSAERYREGAEQGDAEAQFNLGSCYYHGEGIEEDKEEALKWFLKAAEQGLASAQFKLGFIHATEDGFLEDKEEAVKWYRLAAEQDEPLALLNLGVCYVNGEGVEEDKKEAVKCWRKAAEIGCEEAWDYLERFFDGLLERSTTSDLPPIFEQNEIPESQLTDPPGTIINSLGMKLVPIKAGTFLMGGREDEEGYNEEEEQLHTVQITKPYYLGMFQVTQGEYIAVMQENPSVFHGKNRPVEHVSWKEAVEFCTRLSAMPMEKAAGRVYRLPTEAEWEYACRAGSDTAFAFGDELTALQARFCEEIVCEPQPTMPVGMYPPNDWGLHDMHGNVWEWTSDWYALDYYANSPKSDPKGPPTGTHHVLRGGSASVKNFECRCAMRGESARDKPYAKSNARFEAIGDFGLRVVCEIRK